MLAKIYWNECHGGDGGGLYPNNDHRTRLLLQACYYSIHFWLKTMILTFSTKDFCGEKKVGPNSQDFEILEKIVACIFGL
jgi:hypothetical protein